MCEAMRVLMEDEITAGEARGEARGVAIGEARGKAMGEMKKARETAFELYNRKMPLEVIADVIKVNLDTVRSWFAEMPNAAR